MPEYQIALIRRQRIARDTLAFWFDTNGASYQFRAGQHADFAFLQPSPEHERDNSRTFSLANSPLDRQIMIALGIRETAFKAALKAAPLGTRPAVFLAGGIGITPIRSILHWAAQERLPHKLYLFYSNQHLEDAAGSLKNWKTWLHRIRTSDSFQRSQGSRVRPGAMSMDLSTTVCWRATWTASTGLFTTLQVRLEWSLRWPACSMAQVLATTTLRKSLETTRTIHRQDAEPRYMQEANHGEE